MTTSGTKTIKDLVEELEVRKDHGPNDLHRIVYDLACIVKSVFDQRPTLMGTFGGATGGGETPQGSQLRVLRDLFRRNESELAEQLGIEHGARTMGDMIKLAGEWRDARVKEHVAGLTSISLALGMDGEFAPAVIVDRARGVMATRHDLAVERDRLEGFNDSLAQKNDAAAEQLRNHAAVIADLQRANEELASEKTVASAELAEMGDITRNLRARCTALELDLRTTKDELEASRAAHRIAEADVCRIIKERDELVRKLDAKTNAIAEAADSAITDRLRNELAAARASRDENLRKANEDVAELTKERDDYRSRWTRNKALIDSIVTAHMVDSTGS